MSSRMTNLKLYHFWYDHYLPYAKANLKPRTWMEYQRLYKTVIAPALAVKRISHITTKDIDVWHMAERRRAPVQANRALAALSSCLKLAARWGAIPVNPAHGVKQAKEKARKRYLSSDEVKRLLEAVADLPVRPRTFILVALYTGARPGELLSARWEWWTGTTLDLQDSKTGPRVIYVPPVAIEALHYLRQRSEMHLPIFHNMDYRGPWRRVCKTAGIEGARLYDLRHTFASAALAAGQSLEVVSQLLGHRNPQTTRRYTHLMPETGINGASAAARAIEEMGR